MAIALTGGKYKGYGLQTDTRGNRIRPTSGKVRQALFNILSNNIPESVFVDLYAGSGSVGLEAFSRGASQVILVEDHSESFGVLKKNCENLLKGEAIREMGVTLVKSSALRFAQENLKKGLRFDIVFADPPFTQDFNPLWDAIGPLVKPSGCAVIQFPSRVKPIWFEQADQIKVYGESALAFFYAEEASILA